MRCLIARTPSTQRIFWVCEFKTKICQCFLCGVTSLSGGGGERGLFQKDVPPRLHLGWVGGSLRTVKPSPWPHSGFILPSTKKMVIHGYECPRVVKRRVDDDDKILMSSSFLITMQVFTPSEGASERSPPMGPASQPASQVGDKLMGWQMNRNVRIPGDSSAARELREDLFKPSRQKKKKKP